jgi:hypothetical protein
MSEQQMTKPLKPADEGQINKPAVITYVGSCIAPFPWMPDQEIYLSEEEAARYNADPDQYAAEEFGLSKPDYREWIRCDGSPLCGHRLKSGELCNKGVDQFQNAETWKRQHRVVRCRRHS